MTVHRCQAVVAARSWRNPRAKLTAIIVASVSIDRAYVRAIQNVMVPLVGFHDRGPDDDDERDKQKRFDDHVFNPFRHRIHRGSTGHSGQKKSGLRRVARLLSGGATFLQRVLFGWTAIEWRQIHGLPFGQRSHREPAHWITRHGLA
jgi:hypothetical protein